MKIALMNADRTRWLGMLSVPWERSPSPALNVVVRVGGVTPPTLGPAGETTTLDTIGLTLNRLGHLWTATPSGSAENMRLLEAGYADEPPSHEDRLTAPLLRSIIEQALQNHG